MKRMFPLWVIISDTPAVVAHDRCACFALLLPSEVCKTAPQPTTCTHVEGVKFDSIGMVSTWKFKYASCL